jgi:hypothetical protein
MGSSHSHLAKLIASRVIAQNFHDNITDLVKANTKWLPAFATALITDVETVTNNLIGKKAKTTLQIMLTIQWFRLKKMLQH